MSLQIQYLAKSVNAQHSFELCRNKIKEKFERVDFDLQKKRETLCSHLNQSTVRLRVEAADPLNPEYNQNDESRRRRRRERERERERERCSSIKHGEAGGIWIEIDHKRKIRWSEPLILSTLPLKFHAYIIYFILLLYLSFQNMQNNPNKYVVD